MLLVMVVCFAVADALDKGKWTGFISDDDCGAKGNNKEHAACAKKCVKNGAKPVFVVGDKVYAISNPKKVKNFIGDEVTITGTITGDVLEIETIKKKYLEKGGIIFQLFQQIAQEKNLEQKKKLGNLVNN